LVEIGNVDEAKKNVEIARNLDPTNQDVVDLCTEVLHIVCILKSMEKGLILLNISWLQINNKIVQSHDDEVEFARKAFKDLFKAEK
jgi:hypothetical protein